MRGFLTLLFIFVTFSSLLGCGDDKSGGDLLQPLEETEMLEEEELVDVADVNVTDEVDADQDDVADVLLYGTIPLGTTAIDVFEFTDQKDIIFAELVRHPNGIGEDWLTKRVERQTGFPLNIIEQVLTEAKAELELIISFFSKKEGVDRYSRFVEAERQIVLDNKDDLGSLPEKLGTLFEAEFGISFQLAHDTLLKIHLEENPHDAPKVLGTLYGYSDLVFIFGLGRELFPEMPEEEALKRFRMLARAGRTNLIPH